MKNTFFQFGIAALVALCVMATTADVSRAEVDRTGYLSIFDPVLPDGCHYEVVKVYMHAGRTYEVNLMSSSFDTYLFIDRPLNCILTRDDDSGYGTNSYLCFTAPVSGWYYITVSSYSAGETGYYRLTVDP